MEKNQEKEYKKENKENETIYITSAAHTRLHSAECSVIR